MSVKLDELKDTPADAGEAQPKAEPAEGVAVSSPAGGEAAVIVIEPKKGWIGIDFKELWRYRELLYFLTWRDIKIRYKQTALGALWAIIQPTFTMLVFTLFFGRLAKMPSDGIPYPIFVYTGLLPWTYFANAVAKVGNSLVGERNLITKVYFPRLIIPMGSSIAGLVDLAIGMSVLGALMVYYSFAPSIGLLLFPVLVFFTLLLAVGVGLWLSALNVQFRDIKYVIPFMIQIWLFCTPVIYPTSLLKNYAWIMTLNPMGGLIGAYRACVLGHMPINWGALAISGGFTIVIFIGGTLYFRRMERTFADVV
jgi:lipopolysaccharide transport system permease protein